MKIKIANKSITALEISASQIKLAQAEKHSGLIKKLIVSEIKSDSEARIALKGEFIILAVPRQFLTLRIIRLPSKDTKEIEKMVSLQLPKQIPWPVEDIVFDYSVIEKEPSGYSKVLLNICQKETIQRCLRILSQSSLSASRITLTSEGICRWYQSFTQKNKIKDSGAVVILDIDAKNTDICFYERENLIFSRLISFGTADLQAENSEILIEEVQRTISALQRDQVTLQLSKILITTALNVSKVFMEKLKLEFSCAVEAVNPLKDLQLDKEASLASVLTSGSCSVTSILGLALGKVKDEINLLPEEEKKIVLQKNKIKDLISLGILFLLMLGFFTFALVVKIYKKQAYLKKLEQILKEDSPKAKNVETSLKKLELLKERLNPRGSTIEVIYELYNLIPDTISLSVFSFEEGKLITLQGTSSNMSDVFNFQSILEKSPYFKNVEVKYASKRKLRQAEITDFRISAVVDIEGMKKK